MTEKVMLKLSRQAKMIVSVELVYGNGRFRISVRGQTVKVISTIVDEFQQFGKPRSHSVMVFFDRLDVNCLDSALAEQLA